MISNAVLCLKERPNRHFLLILAMAGVALMTIGCGGNPPTMQSSSMGTISVSMSDPPSCAAANSGTTPAPAGGTAAPGGTFTSVFVTIRSIICRQMGNACSSNLARLPCLQAITSRFA